jgi:Spy/CpxP family protein refolding chaperone
MKTGKRSVIIGGLIAVFLLSLVLVGACGQERFCGRGFHPRFHGRAFPDQALNRMDRKVAELGLSETQEKRYREIREKAAADLARMSDKRKALFRDLRSEIDRETPDINEVRQLVKDRLKDMPAFMERHLDHFVEFYNILDEDQKARLLEKARKRMAECEA